MKSIRKFILLAVLFSGCNISTTDSSAQDALIKNIDSYLNEAIDRLKVPGLTMAVTRNDSVIYSRAFGYTNIDSKKPMSTENIFHWASVSKTFVATAIMQLWERKKINMDYKMITYLTYLKQKHHYYKYIT